MKGDTIEERLRDAIACWIGDCVVDGAVRGWASFAFEAYFWDEIARKGPNCLLETPERIYIYTRTVGGSDCPRVMFFDANGRNFWSFNTPGPNERWKQEPYRPLHELLSDPASPER